TTRKVVAKKTPSEAPAAKQAPEAPGAVPKARVGVGGPVAPGDLAVRPGEEPWSAGAAFLVAFLAVVFATSAFLVVVLSAAPFLSTAFFVAFLAAVAGAAAFFPEALFSAVVAFVAFAVLFFTAVFLATMVAPLHIL
ncbi:hypothetical protein AB4Z54_59105, partial [Streptomyces sp. MCAF7]